LQKNQLEIYKLKLLIITSVFLRLAILIIKLILRLDIYPKE
jgi:hypothetical protein